MLSQWLETTIGDKTQFRDNVGFLKMFCSFRQSKAPNVKWKPAPPPPPQKDEIFKVYMTQH